MCELLGLNFNQTVRMALSFRGFRHRGENNPDGWGVARFAGPACQVFKEPINARDSELATFLRDYHAFQSQIFIGHVRRSSQGHIALCNTHPIVRVFRSREVALAHNGTLDRERLAGRRMLKFHPVGATDSEYLFCLLLTRLSEDRIAWDDFQQIEGLLREFNRAGTMNVLFSEGQHLYAYRDRRGYKGLCLTERVAPFGRVSLRDEDWEVDLADEKHPQQRGFVIATHPLTDEHWNELQPGTLNVFAQGLRVYGS